MSTGSQLGGAAGLGTAAFLYTGGNPLAGLVGAGIGGLMGGFGQKKAQVNPYGAMNPDQVQMSKALGPYLTNQIDAPLNTYSGDLNAPITAGEQSIVGANNRLSALSESSLAGLINPDMNEYNKQFDEQMANPQYASFKQNVLPGLQESMPTFSTAMGAATQRGYNDVTNNLAQQRYSGWQSAQDRRLNAISQGATAMNQYAQTAAIPRVIEQAGLTAKYNDWLNANTQKQNSIDSMLKFLGLSTGTYTPAGLTPAGQIATSLLGASSSAGKATA